MAGVTIYPSGKEATSLKETQFLTKTSKELLENMERKERGDILQSSFDGDKFEATTACHNGLVWAVMRAYNHHHHLKIRPDDVWLAVLTQFSAYVNAHAKELRGSFVANEEQQELRTELRSDGRDISAAMTLLLQENVTDPKLRGWILPTFSTTTETDTTVASIVMMGTMQRHLGLSSLAICGLPSVTLLGKKKDYQDILRRLDKLRSYGKEPTQFANLVTAILVRFIHSFDAPKHKNVLNFWNRVVSDVHLGSGMDYYSGWITGFMYWGEDGKPLESVESRFGDFGRLTLGGVTFHVIDMGAVPNGFCTVPLKVTIDRVEHMTEILAGSVAMEWTSSLGEIAGDKENLDTIQARSGWWIYKEPKGGFTGELEDGRGSETGESERSWVAVSEGSSAAVSEESWAEVEEGDGWEFEDESDAWL